MRQDLSKNMFVSPLDVLGYGAVLNFINSGRGLRKTHNYLLWCCMRYIKHKEQFAYSRRQKNEAEENAYGMFTGIEKYNNDIIPAGSFRVVGNNIVFNRLVYSCEVAETDKTAARQTEESARDGKLKVKIKDKLKEGDEIAGHLFALSTAQSKKSTPFPNVRNVIFDEYLSETGEYLRHEVDRWVSLSETVFRDRENVRAFLLGNTVSVVNPYYAAYNIEPQINSKNEITFYRKDGILIQNADRPLFREYKQQRGIQRANRRTEYGRHIIDNVSISDDSDNCGYVRQKQPRFNFIADRRDFGIYTFQNKGGYPSLYIGAPIRDSQTIWRTCDRAVYNRGSHFVLMTSKAQLKGIFERFSTGSLLYFENIEIKQYILPFIL